MFHGDAAGRAPPHSLLSSGPAGSRARGCQGRRTGERREHVSLLEGSSPFWPSKERESGTFFAVEG